MTAPTAPAVSGVEVLPGPLEDHGTTRAGLVEAQIPPGQ
ncbi:hypothetical protein SAMN05421541_107427 [Actinoplanes philippinensis]|uniref:Uncharacterized protein n=1 Tax=Actinoplanes philippinensis TaxID=35752 RepID=A0A1I2H441_9ACTN|nr:hypothetical protein SAMN05421541_107427 [Actinoplanes philippinensis]